MLTFFRTAVIAPGKWREAMSYAHKIAKLVEAKVGVKTIVGLPIGQNSR